MTPPYHPASRVSGRYRHDFTVADHAKLAEEMGRFRAASLVISYYDCPEVRELYPDSQFKFLACDRQKHLHAASGRGDRKENAPEVLIVNRK